MSATDLEVETHDPDYVEGAEEEEQTDDDCIEVETHIDSSSEDMEKTEKTEKENEGTADKTTTKTNTGSKMDNIDTMPQEGLSSDDDGKGAHKVGLMVKCSDQSFLQFQHFNYCTMIF